MRPFREACVHPRAIVIIIIPLAVVKACLPVIGRAGGARFGETGQTDLACGLNSETSAQFFARVAVASRRVASPSREEEANMADMRATRNGSVESGQRNVAAAGERVHAL